MNAGFLTSRTLGARKRNKGQQTLAREQPDMLHRRILGDARAYGRNVMVKHDNEYTLSPPVTTAPMPRHTFRPAPALPRFISLFS